VLAGVVVAGAAIAIVAALAKRDAAPAGRSISYDQIAAAPQPEPAAAPPPPATTPATATTTATTPAAGAAPGTAGEPEPEIEMDPAPAASELEAECRKYLAERKWHELELCADKLQPADPKRAEQLKTRATLESASAPHLAAVEAALEKKDLLRAKAELDRVWKGCGKYPQVKARYDEVEQAAIDTLAGNLEKINAGDCKEYLRVVSLESASKPTRVAAEAQRRVPCVVQTNCNAHQLADKGKELFVAGKRTAALESFEAAWSCSQSALYAQMAFVTACNLPSVAKAKLFWKRLTPQSKTRSIDDCVRNRITQDMLDAP